MGVQQSDGSIAPQARERGRPAPSEREVPARARPRTALGLSLTMALTALALLAPLPALAQRPAPPPAAPRERVTLVRIPKPGAAPLITEVAWGEHIVTGREETAKILYADGSVLLVSPNSEIVVQARKDGTQFNRMAKGEVRGVITKSDAPVAGDAESAAKSPPKFIIRTKAMTMGVRGTDFVVELAAGGARADVHTIEGTVQVAPGDGAISRGEGVFLKAGEATTAAGGRIEGARAFSIGQYLKDKGDSGVDWSEIQAVPAPQSTSSDDHDDQPAPPRLSLGAFRVGLLAAGAPSKRYGDNGLVTTEVSWVPSFRLLGPIGVAGFAAVSPMKSVLGDKFVALSVAALGTLTFFDTIVLEAGPGLETWAGGSGRTALRASAGAGIKFDRQIPERLSLMASIYDGPAQSFSPTAQLCLSVGVKL